MKLLAVGAVVVLGSGFALTQFRDTDKPVDLRVEAAAEGIVTMLIPAGEITVEGWSNNEIEVVGTLEGNGPDISLTNDHGHTELRVFGNDARVTARLHMRVPARSSLDIETTSADLTISGLKGIIGFESVEGNLIVQDNPRGVIARSVSGDIHIPASNIPGFAHSEEGTVRLGPGTGKSAIGQGHAPHQRHPQDGDRYAHLGEHVSDVIREALESADLQGMVEYDRTMRQLTFDISGNLDVDLADLERLLDDVGLLVADIEYQVGDGLAQLSQELERMSQELRKDRRGQSRQH